MLQEITTVLFSLPGNIALTLAKSTIYDITTHRLSSQILNKTLAPMQYFHVPQLIFGLMYKRKTNKTVVND